MDLLKILSRGSKKSGKAENPIAPPAKPTNIQLFHDAPGRGTKRKAAEALKASTDDAADDVDFFAPKESKKPAAKSDDDAKAAKAKKPDAPAPLDDAEVRQILKSHRLKFTILSKQEAESSKVKKSKKKKKQKVETSAKDSKQLFAQPMLSFAELRSYNVSPRLITNLAENGFRLPSEIQIGSLPLLLDPARALQGAADELLDQTKQANFLAVAPTGSGKTLAFLIPAINNVLKTRAEDPKRPHSLDTVILCPTRELAHQIVNEGRKLAAGTGVKVVGFKKGMRIATEQSADMDLDESSDDEEAAEDSEDSEKSDEETTDSKTATKADILVSTPMLLLNFLSKPKKLLPTVRSFVLDEADVLLDPLFQEQTLGILSRLTNESLQLMCWSATMGASIESLVMETLASRRDGASFAPLIRLVVGLKDTAVPSIDHRLIYTGDNEKGKLFAMRQLLHPTSTNDALPDMRLPFLIFVQTIDRATSLYEELKYEFPVEAGGSTRIASLHSNMSESTRSKIITRFRSGEIWVLITTDLLMRGIDFRGVNGVINFDMPTSVAAYVHRVGRSGRAGQSGGVAVTFYTKEDVPYMKSIANVISQSEKQAGKDSEAAVPKWLMDALPKVKKEEKQKLKKRGVESRRGDKAQITSKSAWEKKKENNRRGAIDGSKRRQADAGQEGSDDGKDSEWGGLDD